MSTIITHRQFPHYHKYTMDLAGRPLTLEVGQAGGACQRRRYGHLRRDQRAVLRHRRAPSPGRHRLLPSERGL